MGFEEVDAPLRLPVQALAPGNHSLPVMDLQVTCDDYLVSVHWHEIVAKILRRSIVLSSCSERVGEQ